jgi:hypothetical protein
MADECGRPDKPLRSTEQSSSGFLDFQDFASSIVTALGASTMG